MESPTLEQTPRMVLDLLQWAQGFEKKFKSVTNPAHKPIENPIGIEDAAMFLGRSKPTIYKDVQNGAIPYYKKSGKLYFFKSELAEWVKSGKILSKNELEGQLDDCLSNVKRNNK